MRQLKIAQKVTSRESPATEKYLQEISKIPLLAPEEEVELARRIRMGDKRALDALVRANLRFVVSVAKQYQGSNMPLQDLINEGNIGLTKAAGRFDETRGFKFISYAVWWIRQSIIDALSKQGRLIDLPNNKSQAVDQVRKAWDKLFTQLERMPSDEELSEETGYGIDVVKEALTIGSTPYSLDRIMDEDDESSLSLLDVIESDIESPEHAADRPFRSALAIEVLKSMLNAKEYRAVAWRYGIDGMQQLPLDAIAENLGLTKERTRQIIEKAKHKVRNSKRARSLF